MAGHDHNWDLEDFRAVAQGVPEEDVKLIMNFTHIFHSMFHILHIIDSHFNKADLSRGRFGILIELLRATVMGEMLHPATMAKYFGVSTATVTGLLDNLEKDGLVERKADPDDRRKVMVALTNDGGDFLRDFLPDHLKMMKSTLGAMTREDQNSLKRNMETLHTGMRRHVLDCNDGRCMNKEKERDEGV